MGIQEILSYILVVSHPIENPSQICHIPINTWDGIGRDSRMSVIILDIKLLNMAIFPFTASFLLFHCLRTFFIFGNFSVKLLSVILLSSFMLKVIPSKTNSSVNSSFSFSKFIILPSPLTPSCTTYVFSTFTFKPDTEWKNLRVSNTLFRFPLSFLITKVVSSANCNILCSCP